MARGHSQAAQIIRQLGLLGSALPAPNRIENSPRCVPSKSIVVVIHDHRFARVAPP